MNSLRGVRSVNSSLAAGNHDRYLFDEFYRCFRRETWSLKVFNFMSKMR
jgi:hypothetical protein